MLPIVIHFASGDAIFSGTVLVLATLGLHWSPLFARYPRSIRTLHCCGWIGIALSAAPLPWWLYIAWGVNALLAWRGRISEATEPAQSPRRRQANPATIVPLVLISIAISVHEVQTIIGDGEWTASHDRIYVVGDSLSAGAGESTPPWPARLAAMGFPVTNLAQPGATTRSALEQSARIPDDGQALLVIVEIGGNDLLPGRSSQEFGEDLERLLDSMRRPGRIIAVMELPLYPGANGYGEVQRRVCRRRNTSLISKRVLARALSGTGQTIDGLHLSEAGHQWLAEWFAQRFRYPMD